MKQLALIALLAALAATAQAQLVVARYDFTGSSRASSDTDPNSVASTFDGGAGFQTAGVDNSTFDLTRGNPAPSIAIASTFTDGTTQTQAIAAHDFFTFTISPVVGFSYSFTNLSFDYAAYSSTATLPTENFFVRTSADGFTTNLSAAVTSASATFATASINLSSFASLQNVTGPVEFRIYVYDGTTNAERGALLDNVVVTAVPEPSTYAMMGLGAALLVGVRRFRRKTS